MNNSSGKIGERYVVQMLLEQGYMFIDANYHSRFGEIDIIVADDKYIVFVEVKTRKENSLYAPVLAVTKQKQNKLMKTAMEKKETGLMRQIGYLSFVVVLLYGLTLFAVSCDNDEDPPLPPAVEKVVLAFGVDQGEGQLSAKPELENTAAEKIGELISPAEIAKGTTVHFRATHSKSWTIMYWKVNGVIIRSVEPEQTFVIDEHKEVRVAFKPYKSPEPEGL